MMPTIFAPCTQPQSHRSVSAQRGFTLIELMVALTIATIILLAVSSMYVTQRRVFTTQEVFSSIQDSSRILTRILTHDLRQAGYQDVTSTQTSFKDTAIAGTNGAGASGAVSDTITLIFYGSSPPTTGSAPTYVAEDPPSIVDCGGNAVPRDAYATETFYVATDPANNNISTLFCRSAISNGGASGVYALVEGVESLQFLYGVDLSTALDGSTMSFQPASALTATQMANVKAVMVGAVLLSSITDQPPKAGVINVFGPAYTSASGTGASDPGVTYTPAADGAMRQQYLFTVAIRNRITY